MELGSYAIGFLCGICGGYLLFAWTKRRLYDKIGKHNDAWDDLRDSVLHSPDHSYPVISDMLRAIDEYRPEGD